jgi:hypothetical protein
MLEENFVIALQIVLKASRSLKAFITVLEALKKLQRI